MPTLTSIKFCFETVLSSISPQCCSWVGVSAAVSILMTSVEGSVILETVTKNSAFVHFFTNGQFLALLAVSFFAVVQATGKTKFEEGL